MELNDTATGNKTSANSGAPFGNLEHLIERESKRLLVLSDTHFGDETQMLHVKERVDRFITAISSMGSIDELVLLGDILDLWVKTPMPALRNSKYFVERITGVDTIKEFIYVPGNHDHQMFMNAFRLEMDMNIMQGKLKTPKFMPARPYGDTVLSGIDSKPGGSFPMVYPYIVRRINGKKVLLAHGHHLDFYATRGGWFRTFWLSRYILKKRGAPVTLHEIEMANIPFCGAMSVMPWVPELVIEGLKFYHLISFFAKIFRSEKMLKSPLRDSLIRENYDEIAGLLPLFGHHDADCFIFGHTHRPGVGRIPDKKLLVANCGCWTKGGAENVPAETWLVVDNSVRLYQLDGDEPKLLEEDFL